eukprot:92601-Amphidinium_carterae.3
MAARIETGSVALSRVQIQSEDSSSSTCCQSCIAEDYNPLFADAPFALRGGLCGTTGRQPGK